MILPGLKFVEEYDLTRKEIKVLLKFIERPKTVLEVARELGDNKGSLHNRVNILKLKKMIELKTKDTIGNHYYGITNIVRESLGILQDENQTD
jgi:predicted transcriptional regulator